MPVDFDLYLITDRTQVQTGFSLVEIVAAAFEGGVRAVQLREKALTAAELLPIALALRDVSNRYGAKLFINDRIDVALAVNADGVHLGGHSLPTAAVRKILGPEFLVGVSTHSITEIHDATEQGADFVTFGPVYATPSKSGYGPPRGVAALSEACRQASLPVFALGGVTPEKADKVRRAGASGIAVISAVFAAADPAEAVRQLLA